MDFESDVVAAEGLGATTAFSILLRRLMKRQSLAPLNELWLFPQDMLTTVLSRRPS
jgi:hypothetical protein